MILILAAISFYFVLMFLLNICIYLIRDTRGGSEDIEMEVLDSKTDLNTLDSC